ncbi:metal ABC transporter substrate-binding protein [Halalkalibacterium halodurans]|uniref:Manganese-binding lipoprotein MntA n=1 Tax=Halalkalibacterium halodurans (strain ATCC BAA-125 / DSM 18197 / FERM 7344 / JCM 9153 / C-125) TaxID=272558 RepID=MNTA_HALH5|nr:metal ABC transporter substrate-binding protein [Halalkalibacterium halodurans]Q9KFG3.1 RecName: Full=Manganese-binding lipoprotein MntA; Flags: Precursor [Halalkalibacterium halodurans C-125]MDY7221013.1 metal ABC transporter substrate-binding protein [Halalkalibacterium halodurans]MDY7240252.1 metal ABC transporter substrate-binding protein [Halalkalibacterium halodurans]MED4079903.1 metal ABC transporter substrate-binding protein [Halalkalibacterium halodurans]MED4085278.1 metal ABC tran
MKKVCFSFVIMVIALIAAGCGAEDTGTSEDGEGLKIVTSFSILGDVLENIAGERSSVTYIVPIGEEPHEYEPVPSDFQAVSDADVFYVNGLGLEEWLQRLVENTSDVDVVEVSPTIDALPLEESDGLDPHAWLDVKNVMKYVEVIRDDLVERDPDGAEIYVANAEAYLQDLQELEEWIHDQVTTIPEEQRTIVISENAYRYFGEAYGFDTVGIWELNSHEEGTPGQISRVVDIVKELDLPAVFVETTVNKSFMTTVSNDSGVDIAGEVYTDAVGLEGSGAETYIDMMKHNVDTFVSGLSQ